MDIDKIVRREVREFNSREYAKEEKVENIISNLSLNINPFGVSNKVLNKLTNIDEKSINHYYPEHHELIEEIANYIGASPDQIMLGDGCDGCLQMITSTFINSGDEAIIPIPTFHRYEFHTTMMGGKSIFVQMPDFNLDLNLVIEKINDKTKMIFLCNPNNPTGKEIDIKIKEEIVKNFNGIVVIDEALADAAKINGSSLLDKYENIIIVRSFSKTFGLASLRIGYIIANPKLIGQIRKTSSPFRVNGIAQELAIEALRDKEYRNSSIEYINKNREYLLTNLRRLGIECTDSITTNFLMDVSKIAKSSAEAVELLREKGVLVTDARAFRIPEDKYIRIAIGKEEENKKFIEIISDILGK